MRKRKGKLQLYPNSDIKTAKRAKEDFLCHFARLNPVGLIALFNAAFNLPRSLRRRQSRIRSYECTIIIIVVVAVVI